MASEQMFKGITPFPDDVPTASLYTIQLAALRSGDGVAAKDLLAACQNLGIFMLDLCGDGIGGSLIEVIDRLFEVGAFLVEFKPRGHARTETNEPDRFEWFNIGQDGLMGITERQPLPSLVSDRLSLFTSFLSHGQNIVETINSALATQLGLPADAFTSLQQPTKASGTVIRFIKAFSSREEQNLRTSMIHHTDFGTITLLANVLGGLQILAPDRPPEDKSAWLWVRPRPNCLIVNLGDAMVQWTGGVLRSNVHRINYAPGEQRLFDRYSLALLVRPERDASMRKLVGLGQYGEDDNLTAWEWEVKKAMSLTRKGSKAAAEAIPSTQDD